ncbi:RNA polymerase sigma factor [Micromonospora pallida]|uniref:RNA polymerase sigma factor n=1 Tax=Micromonospora pallida TaxID=145854 RepID=UPI000A47991C|nr:RNA polymerase sigma factor [Micromonospora pallida]
MGRPPPLTDPETFTAFYRAHVDAVLRFVTRRVDDPHLAADITAEVFSAVIASAATYRPDRGNPVAWLYGIARNHIASAARQRAREADRRQRVAGRCSAPVAPSPTPPHPWRRRRHDVRRPFARPTQDRTTECPAAGTP